MRAHFYAATAPQPNEDEMDATASTFWRLSPLDLNLDALREMQMNMVMDVDVEAEGQQAEVEVEVPYSTDQEGFQDELDTDAMDAMSVFWRQQRPRPKGLKVCALHPLVLRVANRRRS